MAEHSRTEQGVTVVVPTIDRGSILLDCLKDLAAQEHRPLEILIVDQSAEVPSAISDFTAQHADLISYHRVSFRGLPRARNFGWQLARYDAIVYVDDDIRCPPQFVTEHLRALRLPNVAVVAGGIDEAIPLPKRFCTIGGFSRWTILPNGHFAARGECDVDHAKGANFSAWREVICNAGGFDERLSGGAALFEEFDFCLRVRQSGQRIYFNGRARLTHLASSRGGCRVADAGEYAAAHTHNQGMLVRRHRSFCIVPVALLRLWFIALSFGCRYRSARIAVAALRGCWLGLYEGSLPPRCSLVEQSSDRQ